MAKISVCYMPERDNVVVAAEPEEYVWGSAETSGRFRVAVVTQNAGFTLERVSRQQYVYNAKTNTIRLAHKDPNPPTFVEDAE